MLFRFLGLNWLDKFSWNWLPYFFYDVTRFPYWTTSKAKSLVGLASLPFPFFLPSLIWSLNFKNWPLHCLIQISYFFIMEQWPVSEILKVSRAVGRSENPGVPVLFGGHNLPPLVEIGLTDLAKSGGAMAPPVPPGTTGLGQSLKFQQFYLMKF